MLARQVLDYLSHSASLLYLSLVFELQVEDSVNFWQF
jgi:hypothetical protein